MAGKGVVMETVGTSGLRPIADDDLDFLFRLYASTRSGEQELASWEDEQWEGFLRMQFNLQHAQYLQNYGNASFDIILVGGTPAGRLYVARGETEVRIIDISILPEFRGHGFGEQVMTALIGEADEMQLPVTLHVERNNPALALYQRLGFQVEEATEVYYFMKRPPAQAEDRHDERGERSRS